MNSDTRRVKDENGILGISNGRRTKTGFGGGETSSGLEVLGIKM